MCGASPPLWLLSNCWQIHVTEIVLSNNFDDKTSQIKSGSWNIGTIFPSFIDFSANYIAQFIILALTYVSLDFVTLLFYGFTAKKISIWLKANPKTINIVSSLALIIIAIIVVFIKV